MKSLGRCLLRAVIGVLSAASANADEGVLKLTLDDAVRLAVAQNLTIRNRAT